MDVSKSDVSGDIPARILKTFSDELAKPVTEVLNSSIKQGKWLEIFKLEIVTPVPKEYPPKDIDECTDNPDICLNGECQNFRGGYQCRCNKGFRYNIKVPNPYQTPLGPFNNYVTLEIALFTPHTQCNVS